MLKQESTTEQWRPVVGYEGFYEVSDHGRLRNARNGRLRVLCARKSGHQIVNLTMPGYIRTQQIHRLVLEAFVGPCPDGMECRHLNGVPDDNRLVNLKWGTAAENGQDRIDLEEIPCGEKHYLARLTKEHVREIRRKWEAGEASQHALAREYGHHVMTINAIVHYKTWKSV